MKNSPLTGKGGEWQNVWKKIYWYVVSQKFTLDSKLQEAETEEKIHWNANKVGVLRGMLILISGKSQEFLQCYRHRKTIFNDKSEESKNYINYKHAWA